METKIEMAVVPEEKVEKTCKIVNDASIARKLLKDGFKMVDIKPKRNHERETIFVFEVSDGFMSKMEEYINAKKSGKDKKKVEE